MDDGVRLRPVVEADLPLIYEHRTDPESCRMAVANPRSRDDFEAAWAGYLRDPSVVARAIVAGGKLVGSVSCFTKDEHDEVGYWIGRAHWGRGYATRGLALLLEEVAIRPLHARVARTNAGSIRVLEKCGFVVTGYRVSPPDDHLPSCEEAELRLG